MTMPATGQQHGVVTGFDRAVGLGTVHTDHGGSLPFHCIEIADGSRDISVGTRVTFVVLAKFGRFQAASVTPE